MIGFCMISMLLWVYFDQHGPYLNVFDVALMSTAAFFVLLATITKAPKVQEIAVLFSGLYLSYNERETGLTVPCLSCHARSCKLSAGPLIAAFDLRRLKHRSASVYSCNKAS